MSEWRIVKISKSLMRSKALLSTLCGMLLGLSTHARMGGDPDRRGSSEKLANKVDFQTFDLDG